MQMVSNHPANLCSLWVLSSNLYNTFHTSAPSLLEHISAFRAHPPQVKRCLEVYVCGLQSIPMKSGYVAGCVLPERSLSESLWRISFSACGTAQSLYIVQTIYLRRQWSNPVSE